MTILLQTYQKFYSPLVRSISKREGIAISELDQISGSGRGGRVNKNDLMKFIETGKSSTAGSISTFSNMYLNDKIEEMDPVRKRISEHMIHSQETSAHVYSTIDIDMTNLLQVKDTYGKIYKDKHSIKLTITALIIDACIKALNEFPLLNASIDGSKIIHHKIKKEDK